MPCTTDELVCGAEAVGNALKAAGASVVTVESCTGGWVGQCLTGVGGASAWYERGFVAYSNRSKIELLGVDAGDHLWVRHDAENVPKREGDGQKERYQSENKWSLRNLSTEFREKVSKQSIHRDTELK